MKHHTKWLVDLNFLSKELRLFTVIRFVPLTFVEGKVGRMCSSLFLAKKYIIHFLYSYFYFCMFSTLFILLNYVVRTLITSFMFYVYLVWKIISDCCRFQTLNMRFKIWSYIELTENKKVSNIIMSEQIIRIIGFPIG